MKKSRIAKFALMGASMAALAATLGTSTYAWYVTNSTATAGNIAITTSASGDGNLLLAQAKPTTDATPVYNTLVPGNFTQTLNLVSQNVVAPQNGLVPTTPGTFTLPTSPATLATEPGTLTADATLANWVGVEGTADNSNPYAEFKIWVMATSNATANYTLKVTNTTATKKTQYAYSLDGLGSTVDNLYETFGVDAIHSLRIGVTEGTTTGNAGEYTYAIGSGATYTIYDEKATVTSDYSSTVTTWNDPTGMNANEYFNSILGTYPVGSTVANNTTTWSKADPVATAFGAVTLDANKPVLLQFRVWLEGTDSACFDSCGGQSFAFNFSFTKTNRS